MPGEPKKKNEIDFILQSSEKTLFIEVKLGIHSAKAFHLDPEAIKVFGPDKDQKKIVVTAGGEITPLNTTTEQVPIQKLGEYLLEFFRTREWKAHAWRNPLML